MWVAVLHAGERSALCGLTAAESLGLRGYEVAPVHVLVERGVHVPELESEHLTLVVHETRRLSPEDLHPAREPRRTRFPRSIVDAASDADDDLRCMALLAASVQQRRTRVHDLRDEVERTVRIPRRRLIVETLDDIEGGAYSVPEIEFLRGVRAAGLPEPTRQRILRRPDGRYYLDASWDEFRVAAEIDGAHHLLIAQRVADDVRRNSISAKGVILLHFSSYAVRHLINEVVALLREALETAAAARGLSLRVA